MDEAEFQAELGKYPVLAFPMVSATLKPVSQDASAAAAMAAAAAPATAVAATPVLSAEALQVCSGCVDLCVCVCVCMCVFDVCVISVFML